MRINESDSYVRDTIILGTIVIVLFGMLFAYYRNHVLENELSKTAMENGYEQVFSDGRSTPLWKKVDKK